MAQTRTTISRSNWVTARHLGYLFFAFTMVAFAFLLLAPEPINYIPFALIIGITLIVAACLYPTGGLIFYLFVYLVRPQELYPYLSIAHYPYEKFAAGLVALSIVVNYLLTNRKFRLFDLDRALLLFMGALLISVMTATWVGGAKEQFIIVFKMMVVYFFISRLASDMGKFKAVVWFYALSVGFIAISSTWNYYTGHFETAMGIQRAAGMAGEDGALSDPNSMASSLVLGIPFIIGLFKYYKGYLIKTFLVAIILICLWTIIISGSRGGMLGAIIMLGIIAYNSRHRAVALVVSVVLIIAAAALMPKQYVDRFATIAQFNNLEDDVNGAADSAQGRIKGLKVGLEILLVRPIAGVGIGCFTIYNYENHGSWLQPHNMVGQLAGEVGFIGLITFGFFIFRILRNIKYSLRRSEEDGDEFTFQIIIAIKISLAMLFFLGLFGHNLYRFNWYFFAGILAAAAELLYLREVTNRNAEVESV